MIEQIEEFFNEDRLRILDEIQPFKFGSNSEATANDGRLLVANCISDLKNALEGSKMALARIHTLRQVKKIVTTYEAFN